MRIGYVTTYDPQDRAHWSGLGAAIMRCLEGKGTEIRPLGPLRSHFRLLGRIKASLNWRLFRQSYEFERTGLAAWDYARQVENRLRAHPVDLVFSPGAIPVSRLRCNQPVVLWADATFDSLISHYPQYSSLSKATLDAGHRTDRLAYEKCSLVIFASQWAADSARAVYGVPSKKVKVIPFGANFDRPPTRERALQASELRPTDRCSLITIGVDWIRKGVPRAIALAEELNRQGLRTQLTVVGCLPPPHVSIPDFVTIVGFVDKRTIAGEAKLTELLLNAHFHVLFSAAEAFGVVFAEANAHAVPNIASDCGGIPSAVVNGRGGQRFRTNQPIAEVAAYVQEVMNDRAAYVALARTARDEYELRLNWGVIGAEVQDSLFQLVNQGRYL